MKTTPFRKKFTINL